MCGRRLSVSPVTQQLLTTSCSTYRRHQKKKKKTSVCFSRLKMELQTWTCVLLLLLAAAIPPAEATTMADPQLCYILDGFLGLYGLIITGMFIKEKFFRSKAKPTEESIYSDLQGQDTAGYAPLMRDPEKARNRRTTDEGHYARLNKTGDGEYKELPATKREHRRKNDQVYQGLSSVTRDTYDSLQMQQLPPR